MREGGARSLLLDAAICILVLALLRTTLPVCAISDTDAAAQKLQHLTSALRGASLAWDEEVLAGGRGSGLTRSRTPGDSDWDAVGRGGRRAVLTLQEMHKSVDGEDVGDDDSWDGGSSRDDGLEDSSAEVADVDETTYAEGEGSDASGLQALVDSDDEGGGDEDASDDASAASQLPPPPPEAEAEATTLPVSPAGVKPGRPPPLELKVIENQPAQVSIPAKCVFILGTGRSGSTQLMDALNQLPHYLIRGEQEGAFWFLYLAWRMLRQSMEHSTSFKLHQRQAETLYGTRDAGWLSYDTVKRVYDKYAVEHKLPWFNDLHDARVSDAARAFYATTYGYHGLDIVSGFKEIRFVCGRAFPSPGCRYSDFDGFIRFLRLMCKDTKVLLNSRSSAALSDNHKLITMLARDGVRPTNGSHTFEEDLEVTHSWYDRYAKEHPGSAFRVIMEDMFDGKKNATLIRSLLRFLKEDPRAKISFTRMPSWSVNRSKSHRSRPRKKEEERDPWNLRRQQMRRQLLRGSSSAAASDAVVL